jgi:hypothetical protein
MRFMWLWAVALMTALLVGAALDSARAQGPLSGMGLLDIPPENALVCHLSPAEDPSKIDSRVAHMFRFDIGDTVGALADSRTLFVAYDRNGNVLQLAENNMRSLRPGAVIETIFVSFLRTPPQGIHSRLEHRDHAKYPGPATETAITATDMEKARRLAPWLWARRCDASEDR